ncbi:Copper chaperone CopZ [Sanguibacter gelidistatuariae]|uniref:Copper chaperone CopZ n=1 Tax=Sanguibacter gelidistatuariae TaxID=1814289 RepID=A0A1G6SYY0_9MICO|nr:heavy-metal-associated domain-containing protein [Sanguibacter gelidistatuariae]SDD22112.1 Copper chaperone CopZ [Sanguibacter gelidistatuariae]
MVTTAFAVEGLTCGSCLAEVLEQMRTVAGVSGAAIDLVVGGRSPVVVTSGAAMRTDQIRAAVEQAGFVLAADDRRAGPHDHGPEHVLATRISELDNSEFFLGGVR